MPLTFSDYPHHSYDKLRYGDTDRQGHINNAVFSTLLETGRVEFLLSPDDPLTAPGCAFVIARLTLDFIGELNWPGRVEIGSGVLKLGRSSVTIRQGLFQNGQLCAAADTVIVQMDETTRKSAPLSPAAVARLEALLLPPTQQEA